MDSLNFIKSMFEHAQSLNHFKLCQRCILSFLSRVSSPIEPEIGGLFYFIVEMFVLKACPDYNIDDITEDSIWGIQIEFTDSTVVQ